MDVTHRRRERALAAFRCTVKFATNDGLRDLHEALQTTQFAIAEGKARLVRGSWGTLGAGETLSDYTGCPLNALYIREARARGGGLKLAVELNEMIMRKNGFTAADFYQPWDAGLLGTLELRDVVETELTERLNARLNLPF